MLIPEQLWIPTLKDLRSQFAPQIVDVNEEDTQANASISITLVEPEADQLLIVTGITVVGRAGAAQNVTDMNCWIVDSTSGGAIHTIFDSTTVGYHQPLPDSQGSVSLQGNWYLLRGQTIRSVISFDAGAANNVSVLSIHGVKIPRGNWQRGR